jgi:hypothetical protein
MIIFNIYRNILLWLEISMGGTGTEYKILLKLVFRKYKWQYSPVFIQYSFYYTVIHTLFS